MGCVPKYGGDMLGDLLLGKDAMDDWAGLSLYEQGAQELQLPMLRKKSTSISRGWEAAAPLDIPRSQQEPDVNSRICRSATLDRPFPRQCPRKSASKYSIAHPNKRHPRYSSGSASLPDKSVGFHASAPSRRLYRMRLPGRKVRRRGADIAEYSPGSRLF